MYSTLRRWKSSCPVSVALIALALLTLLADHAYARPPADETDEDLYRCAQEALEKSPQDCVAAFRCLSAYIDRNGDNLQDSRHKEAVFQSWQGCLDQLAVASEDTPRYLKCEAQLKDMSYYCEKDCPDSTLSDIRAAFEKIEETSFLPSQVVPLLPRYPSPGASEDTMFCIGGGDITLTYYNTSSVSTRPHILVAFVKAPGPALNTEAGKARWQLHPGECGFEAANWDPSAADILILRDPWFRLDQSAISWTAANRMLWASMPEKLAQYFMQPHYGKFGVFRDASGYWVVTRAEPVYDVILTGSGEKKISVIKAVRAMTGLGLKEAKELVESVPVPVWVAVPLDVAEDAKRYLDREGASVDITEGPSG